MDLLQELAGIIQKTNIKALKQVEALLSREPRSLQLLKLLVRKSETKEEEIAQCLYYTDKTNKTFISFKKKLFQLLCKTLLFLDPNQAKANSYESAYNQCWKDLAAAKILLSLSAKQSGLYLIKNVLKKARKYEFTLIIMECSSVLRLHYATIEGDKKQFEKYNEIFEQQKEIYFAEKQAEAYYSILIQEYISNKGAKERLRGLANTYCEEIRPLMMKYHSIRLCHLGYLIEAKAAIYHNNYQATLSVCEEAIAHFQNRPTYFQHPIPTFLIQKLICHIHQKQLPNGQTTVKLLLQKIKPGSSHWFVTQYLHLLLAFHTQNDQVAIQIFLEVKGHSKFKNLSIEQRERWQIIEAYVKYLSTIQGLDYFKPKLKIQKFLNEVSLYTKDKKGLNISILIIQLLWLIQLKKYHQMIKRSDALNIYCSRYLKKDENFRSNCFIKMLIQVIKADFHPVAAQRKAAPYFKRLSDVPFESSGQAYEVELIPYERLWEMVLRSLSSTSSQWNKPNTTRKCQYITDYYNQQ